MKVFYHPNQALHHPKTYYSRGQMRSPQELPLRIEPLLEALNGLGYSVSEPADTGEAALSQVHSAQYLEFLKSAHTDWLAQSDDWGDEVVTSIFVREPNALRGILAKAAKYQADGSCPIGEHTWTSVYWAAQSAIAGADALLQGERSAYALCRPPGHHARYDSAGGFCYLNNNAIAAQRLRQKFKRVVVLDTDMHHGQGTQEIFWERDDVFTISIHGSPENFYPVVTGFEDEQGSGAGKGYNLNLPMSHGSSEATFFEKLDAAFEAIRAYKPDVLVHALGFDIYKDDPQARVSVSTEGFAEMGRRVRALGLPTLVVQEGGYHFDTLNANLTSYFRG